MNKILIVVSGGVVQNVYAQEDVEVEVLDYDDLESDKSEGNDMSKYDRMKEEKEKLKIVY